jgi:hypothetical protein
MSRRRGALHDPLLSVVMPVYNARAAIADIIGRVLAVPLRVRPNVVEGSSTVTKRARRSPGATGSSCLGCC